MYHGFISLNIKCEPVEDGAIYRGHEKMALLLKGKAPP